MTPRSFDATLEQAEDVLATYVVIPFDVREAFGRVRPPVRGTVNGTPFRSTVAVYGGRFHLGVNRQLREGAGAAPGDTVRVEIELDTEPRVVEPPEDLRAALDAEPEAAAAFDRLSYTHRREYVEWIEEAKRDETRRRRIARAVELVRSGGPPP